jgi:hypothetical protein
MRYIYVDGTPCPPNSCVTPDNHVVTFTITVRSNSDVTAEQLKRVVQSRHEVVGCAEIGHVVICRK